MASRTRKKTLYLAAESTFSADPSANGSGYTSVPLRNLSELSDGLAHLETNYFTGRLEDTVPVVGADSAEISFTVPLIGLSAAAGDGQNVPADDWLDILLTHMFGVQRTHTGEGVAVGSTGSNLVLDATVVGLDDNDLVAVYDAILTSVGRTQWARVTDDSSEPTYDITPVWAGAPTDTGVAYGLKEYRFQDDGGATLAAVFVDDQVGTYTLTGGRVTAFAINADAGGLISADVTMRFDDATEDAAAKTQLPASVAAPAITPVILQGSPVWFNGSQLGSVASVNIAFNVEATRVRAAEATNGRSDDVAIRMVPRVTVAPLRTDGIREFRRLLTQGEVLVQLGAGILSGGVLNTLAFNMMNAYAEEVSPEDDESLTRQSVVFKTIDPGATGVAYQFARA